MKYMGSKARLTKYILPIILADIKEDQFYVELFVGGCNLIDKVKHPLRIGNDINENLIALWVALQNGWSPPDMITREQYYDIKDFQEVLFDPELVGYVCHCSSYSGKPFSGYAGVITDANGKIRNYQQEAKNNLLAQVPTIADISFSDLSYDRVIIPNNSIIYCDPPYKGTTGYRSKFNHDAFWAWCRATALSHKVYISEYSAPDDFICILKISVQSSLASNGMYASESKKSIEKLFIHKSQYDRELDLLF